MSGDNWFNLLFVVWLGWFLYGVHKLSKTTEKYRTLLETEREEIWKEVEEEKKKYR